MKKFNQKIIILIVAVFTISFNANSQDEHICQEIANQATEYAQLYGTCEGELTSAAFWSNYYETEYNSTFADLNAANQQIYSLQSQLNNSLTQADVAAAVAAAVAAITPEDGISQADVDAAVAAAVAAITPEDGISQSDVDNATPLSIHIPVDLPQGWSILGYTCVESTDVVDALADVVNAVEIVKDEMGLSYLPSWNFNAIGDFKYAEGYQIKLYESINELSFCSTLRYKLLGCTDQTAFNFNIAANTDDGSCVPVIEGCTDQEYFEFNINANTDDGSCEILSVFGCTDTEDPNYEESANVNDGSCVINIGCTNPEASNYDPVANECANEWDCECTYETYGCTNSAAVNYNSEATINKGCVYQLQAGPNCSSLEILSTVTNAFDNLPSGISVQDEVSFSIDLNSSEWNVGSDQNNDDFFFDENSIGSNFTVWQAAHPVSYTISYTSGYSESGQITSINVIDGGINLYASTYYYNQGGEWIMDWTNGQDKIEFYDGDTKIYDMQMGEDANLSYASNIGDVASALTNTYVSGTFYWANYQVSTPWTTYHQDFLSEQDSTSFSATETDCTGCTDTQSFNFDSNAVIDDNSCIEIVNGCTDEAGCNFYEEANTDNGSCDYLSCYDECGVMNGDNSTCLDCAGVPNGSLQNLACGCGMPAIMGYDCDGNLLTLQTLQIGDFYQGGYVFQINEDGTGLVASLEDIEVLPWNDAMLAASNSTAEGFEDWRLPTLEELELMYNTIGQGADNVGGFSTVESGNYWSSEIYPDFVLEGMEVISVFRFTTGLSNYYGDAATFVHTRIIREF
jgi:hypothetical protein